MTVKIRELRIKADFTRSTASTTEAAREHGSHAETSEQRNLAQRTTELAKNKKSNRER